jgi:hypothetical protein
VTRASSDQLWTLANVKPIDDPTVEGCIAAGADQLAGGGPVVTGSPTGSLSSVLTYADQLIDASVVNALTNPSLSKTFGSWSSCMATAGYPQLRRPQDAIQATNMTGNPTPAEITQAIHDVTCKDTSGLTSTWAALVRADQLIEIKNNIQQLQQARARLDSALVRAQDVLRR